MYHYVHDHILGVFEKDKNYYRGKLTGEFRSPKKGEWYLSGAIPECYLAPNDLSMSFYIVKIVEVKKIEYYIEVD